jgi:hypoxanthine phosphoribosyltransferase
MKSIINLEKMSKEIIPSKDLQTAINGLSQIINEYCNKQGGGIVFICVMKGGFMFFSDLIKKIKYPIEVDFVKCSSYDGQSQKVLEIHYDIETNVKDKTVFLVDDILDSGKTMNALKEHYKILGAKQVETVSAVYKENVDFPDHLFIYKQPEGVNPWYIGYGMDGPKGYSRNLDTIHKL